MVNCGGLIVIYSIELDEANHQYHLSIKEKAKGSRKVYAEMELSEKYLKSLIKTTKDSNEKKLGRDIGEFEDGDMISVIK